MEEMTEAELIETVMDCRRCFPNNKCSDSQYAACTLGWLCKNYFISGTLPNGQKFYYTRLWQEKKFRPGIKIGNKTKYIDLDTYELHDTQLFN